MGRLENTEIISRINIMRAHYWILWSIIKRSRIKIANLVNLKANSCLEALEEVILKMPRSKSFVLIWVSWLASGIHYIEKIIWTFALLVYL